LKVGNWSRPNLSFLLQHSARNEPKAKIYISTILTIVEM